MHTSYLKSSLTAMLAALALAACAPQQSGTVVSPSQAQTASQVRYGVITSSRSVVLSGNQADQALGAVVGGVAGAAAGQQVGGGRGRVLATGAGAVAGAALGQRAGAAVGQTESIEWFVRLENGQNISVIQRDPVFVTGQRVQVIVSGDGTARLAPA